MPADRTKILVTGGAGYLGERVVADLLAHGHSVRVFDVVPQSQAPHEGRPGVEYIQGDLLATADVVNAVAGVAAVVHLAARVVSRAPRDDAELASIWTLNHEAAVRLAHAAQAAGVRKFLFASTTGCYTQAKPEAPADEDSPVSPTGPYAESKVRAEGDILGAHSPEFATTILRFASLFGASPRMNLEPLINGLVRDAVSGGRLVLFGPKAWRPFLHVEDAARATRLVLEAPSNRVGGRIFNVGDAALHRTKEAIAGTIRKRLPNVEVALDPRGDARDFCVSFQRIHDVLGFRASRSLEDGIDELIRQIQQGSARPTPRPGRLTV